MKKVKTVTIALTGGLGNQLFQLAAALDNAKSGKVQILGRQGKPRLNKFGDPEILSFNLPSNVIVIKGGFLKWVSSKIIGFNLRSGFNPTKFEIKYRPLVHLLSRIFLLTLTGRNWSLSVADNIGLPTKIKIHKNALLIGYFQTYQFIERLGVENFISGLSNFNFEVEEHRILAEKERPLIVHVRLGDYKNENNIGVLSSEYYLENCKKLFDSGTYGKIWLFSDEPDRAIKVIEPGLLPNVRVINSQKFSSAETLELMTFGRGYLIANSTFSWWGAYLSKTPNPEVVAPSPWFKNLPEPRELVPMKWNRAKGFS